MVRRSCAFIPVLLLSAIPLLAQDEEPPSVSLQSETVEASSPAIHSGAEPESVVLLSPPTTSKNDRLFFVMPNYLTVENQEKFDLLTTGTKFKLSAKTMSDPVTVSFIGAIALIGQAQNSNPAYGQGVHGYAKRYATFYADTGIGTLMTTSVFPTLLRQDPRYFQLGHGGVWRRTVYALSRIVVARSDCGMVQFNSSEVLGTAVAAGISTIYHPRDQRTLSNTIGVWSTNIALNALCNIAKEFWPDVRRRLHKSTAQ